MPQQIVPFRQCRLTELLFSNSFPSLNTSTNHHHGHSDQQKHSLPQKGVVIVTADPLGDFNATSQILRYSAIAREVTVPRIPSVTSTILSGALLDNGTKRPGSSGRTSPTISVEELEHAHLQIASLHGEVELLQLQLAEQTERRLTAEESWRAAEQHMLEVEQQVRDECADDFDRRLEAELRRWKCAWDEQTDRADEHLDRKIEILAKGVGINVHEDPEAGPEGSEEAVEGLERENETLKRRIEMLERELQGRSPTKKQRVLKAKKWEVEGGFDSP